MKWYEKLHKYRSQLIPLCGVLVIIILLLIFLIVTAPGDNGPHESGVDFENQTTESMQESEEPVETEETSPDMTEEATSIEETETELQTEETTEVTTAAPTTEAPTTPAETSPPPTTAPPKREEEVKIANGDLKVEQFAVFSGQFVEDGRDELVENVAAILVKNKSEKFLDFAVLTYQVDGQDAAFVVTGLPAGESAWVMEITKLKAKNESKFVYQDCISSFRDSVMASSEDLEIQVEGNTMKVINRSDDFMYNIFVYYKNRHSDGNYFGGITYAVEFGTLAPNTSAHTIAGHYQDGVTEIIRVGWQTS